MLSAAPASAAAALAAPAAFRRVLYSVQATQLRNTPNADNGSAQRELRSGLAWLRSYTVDTIVLQNGSYKVAHPVTSTSNYSNPATCLNRIIETGTFRVFDGTGKYAGIRGHGTFKASVLFIAARASGACSQTKPPVAFQLIITASGPASLP